MGVNTSKEVIVGLFNRFRSHESEDRPKEKSSEQVDSTVMRTSLEITILFDGN
jgi:hypothetical protein